MELAGKTAFITGAARGIGQASACAFARAGANVMIADLEQSALAETEKMVRDIGVQVASMAVDVTSSARVTAAIKATVERFGRLDCALNNAGLYPPQADLVGVDEATARRVMEVNYWGVFYGMRAQIEAMLPQGGGTIVNIASGAGLFAFPLSSAYCASKHAVVGLTKSAAIDYASRGVRINCVCPGLIKTKMIDPLLENEAARAALTAATPIGRIGQPTEIADAVIWLSSTRSSFVVGDSIVVDGGYTAL
jgi:NAD(P)-dependent dehydrogenase (short-subunit alcohol dehydrogenase family)